MTTPETGELTPEQRQAIEADFATIFQVADQPASNLRVETLIQTSGGCPQSVRLPEDIMSQVYPYTHAYHSNTLVVSKLTKPDGQIDRLDLVAKLEQSRTSYPVVYERTVLRAGKLFRGLAVPKPYGAKSRPADNLVPASERYVVNFADKMSRLARICLYNCSNDCQVSQVETPLLGASSLET